MGALSIADKKAFLSQQPSDCSAAGVRLLELQAAQTALSIADTTAVLSQRPSDCSAAGLRLLELQAAQANLTTLTRGSTGSGR